MPIKKGSPSNNPKGVPKKTIDWKKAKKLAEMQCTQEEIAAWFEIDVNTLKEIAKREKNVCFSHWLREKAEKGKCSLRRSMYLAATNAKGPSVPMLIWLSKNYLGMQDNMQHDVTDKTFNLAYALGK